MSEETPAYQAGNVSATLPTAAIVPTALPSAVVLHVSQPSQMTVNASVEKNTKGFNWSATIIGAPSVEAAIAAAKEARAKFEAEFGQPKAE
jgi:hypothetical protein